MRDFRTFSHIQKRCARSTVSPSFNRPLPAKKNFANKNFVISHISLHHNPSVYHPSTYAEKLSHHPTSYFHIVRPNPWRVGEDSHNFPDPPPVGPCKRIGRDVRKYRSETSNIRYKFDGLHTTGLCYYFPATDTKSITNDYFIHL